MSRKARHLIVGGLAAFLASLTLLGSCVCTPIVDLPVKVDAPVKVAADVASPHAELTIAPATTAGRDIIAENANWIIVFAIGWPMLCVLAGFILYMVLNRVPAIRAVKDRVKGLHRLALVSQWPKSGILDAVKPKRTPPPGLPVVAVCPRCGAEFSPRLDGPPLSPEIDGD